MGICVRYRVDGFLRSSLFLSFSSSVVPQFVSFIGMLFLARLYTPEDYGHLAFGMAVAAVLSVLASLRYEAAVVVAEEEDVFPLIFLALIFSIIVSILYGFAVLFLGGEIWVIVFSIAQASLSLAASYWMRSESFIYIFWIRISAAFMNFIFPFLFFWAKVDDGLFNGLMVASFLVFCFLVVLYISYAPVTPWHKLPMVFRRYFYFTGKSLPGYLVNTISYQAGYFMIPSCYGAGVAGAYFQVFRIGYLPMSMLSTAVAQFFYARVSKLKLAADVRLLMVKVHILMFFVMLPYCILLFFWPEALVALVLGDRWMRVAEYLPYLAWFFFLSSIVSSTSSVFHLYRLGWFELFFNCFLAIVPVALIVFFGDRDFLFYILGYSLLSGAGYLYLLVWSYAQCGSLERR